MLIDCATADLSGAGHIACAMHLRLQCSPAGASSGVCSLACRLILEMADQLTGLVVGSLVI